MAHVPPNPNVAETLGKDYSFKAGILRCILNWQLLYFSQFFDSFC